jgi:N-acyl-D-amino-acid deacylase
MRSALLVLFVLYAFADSPCCQSQPPQTTKLDYLLINGEVYDGKGQAPIRADIGITGDRITYMGNLMPRPPAEKIIDATGLVVSPGFIDPHTHTEDDLINPRRSNNLPYLMQGVTTVFAGNDGTSPVNIGVTLSKWESIGIGTNAALFIGHGSVRKVIVGLENRKPTTSELDSMKHMISSAMKEGAFGLSSGLFYAPGSYAETEEVTALARIAAQHQGIYDTHIRDESSYTVGLLAAVEEALSVGRDADIPVHISHIKALGSEVWGKSRELIERIELAHHEGIQVSANLYPYVASRTSLIAAVIPRWAEDGGYTKLMELVENAETRKKILEGIHENILRRGGGDKLILSFEKDSTLHGKSLRKIAEQWSLSEEETTLEILRRDQSPRVVSFSMAESDLVAFMQRPWVMIGSDGTTGHPRKFGTFVRTLEHYVFDKQTLTLEEAIQRSTSLTAQTLGISQRGELKVGYFADIIIFDKAQLHEKATFDNPSELATGMRYVWVNGQLTINEGAYTGVLSGRALRKNVQ